MGPNGVVNAQRTLNVRSRIDLVSLTRQYIRTLAQFISQPEYGNVVPMFSILNEGMGRTFGEEQLKGLCVLATLPR